MFGAALITPAICPWRPYGLTDANRLKALRFQHKVVPNVSPLKKMGKKQAVIAHHQI